ncbi:YdbL family protein [Zavarzinia sp. CC-PAN008]|uniref:YdbL family protein n=1 Tax=Zavarzinia sp. CC-PAN008 TaxID=3243332 RepID=UPI003F745F51
MLKRLAFAVFLAVSGMTGAATLAVAPAHALTLDEARRAGQIGEMRTGFVGVVAGGADVKALADQINAQRRSAYADIAAKNGTSVDAVGALTAEQLIGRLPAGAFYQDTGGGWVRK